MLESIEAEIERSLFMQKLLGVGLVISGLVCSGLAVGGVAQYLAYTGRQLEAVVLVLAAIGLTWYVAATFRKHHRWSRNLNLHPAFNCPTYGEPGRVRRALQAAWTSPAAIRLGNVRIIPEWVVKCDLWRLESAHLPAVAWAYKKVVESKYYGLITIRKAFRL